MADVTDLRAWAEGIEAPLGRGEDGQPIVVKIASGSPTGCRLCGRTDVQLIDYTDEELGAKWKLCGTCFQKHLVGQPYMPSTGTEGLDFASYTCDVCEAGRLYREATEADRLWTAADMAKDCPILPRALCGEQPDEWVRDQDGHPICTAFIPERTTECLGAQFAHEAEQQRLAAERKSLERQGQGLLF